MTYFSGYDMNDTIGQSCREFKSLKSVSGRETGRHEGISCSSCRNWNGAECIRNHYDSVASRLGID